jgi:hypothetical protein
LYPLRTRVPEDHVIGQSQERLLELQGFREPIDAAARLVGHDRPMDLDVA